MSELCACQNCDWVITVLAELWSGVRQKKQEGL